MTLSELVPVAPGVRLRVLETPGPERPFLLVHGLSSNARLWDRTAAALAAAGHRVVAVDLRSHGQSDAPESGYDTATAAADLAALIAARGLAGAVVAGQSWGGNVVVELAARSAAGSDPADGGPEPAVAAIGLVDGGWIDLSAEFGDWEACRAALTPPDVDGMRASSLRGHLRAAHPDWGDWALDATMANFRVAADDTLARRLPIAQHMQIVRSLWDDPPAKWLPEVRVPATLIPAYGGPRAARQEDRVAAAAALLPDARIRAYPGADHDIHAQHPEALAADLLALAGRVR